jgi:hypothetical protein
MQVPNEWRPLRRVPPPMGTVGLDAATQLGSASTGNHRDANQSSAMQQQQQQQRRPYFTQPRTVNQEEHRHVHNIIKHQGQAYHTSSPMRNGIASSAAQVRNHPSMSGSHSHRSLKFNEKAQRQSQQPASSSSSSSMSMDPLDTKKRRLPYFLDPNAADQQDAMEEYPVAAASPQLAQNKQSTKNTTTAPSLPIHNAWATPKLTKQTSDTKQKFQIQTNNNNAESAPRPPVQFMPRPPNICLPTDAVVQVASTREEGQFLAKELRALLTLAEEERAAPGATQTLGAAPTCACPIGAVGFDLEWRPNFRRGEAPNPVALLQLAGPLKRIYLFQIIHWALPNNNAPRIHDPIMRANAARMRLGPELADLLSDPRILKVGVGVTGDVSKLLMDFDIQISGALDLSTYANERLEEFSTAENAATITSSSNSPSPTVPTEFNAAASSSSTPLSSNGTVVPGILPSSSSTPTPSSSSSSPPPLASPSSSILPVRVTNPTWSLAKLVAHCLGLELPKPKKVRMSNWELSPLTSGQKNYAALDALVGLQVYEKLHQQHQIGNTCTQAILYGMNIKSKPKRIDPAESSIIPVEITVRTVSPSITLVEESDDFDLTDINSNSNPKGMTKRQNIDFIGSNVAATAAAAVTVARRQIQVIDE